VKVNYNNNNKKLM